MIVFSFWYVPLYFPFFNFIDSFFKKTVCTCLNLCMIEVGGISSIKWCLKTVISYRILLEGYPSEITTITQIGHEFCILLNCSCQNFDVSRVFMKNLLDIFLFFSVDLLLNRLVVATFIFFYPRNIDIKEMEKHYTCSDTPFETSVCESLRAFLEKIELKP